MTVRRVDDPAEAADLIDAWLRVDIAERGGTGRRLWRCQWEVPGVIFTDDVARQAFGLLTTDGRCHYDDEAGAPFGFVYLIPDEP